MGKLRSNVKFIIWAGFSSVITLLIILSTVAIYQLNMQSVQFREVVLVDNSKISIAHQMRDAVRMRSLSLNRMALSDDIFYRDEERDNFDKFANRFQDAYKKFETFNLNFAELEIQKLMLEKINIGFPLNQEALTILLDDGDVAEVNPVIVRALVAQEAILFHLDELIILQQSYAETSLADTERGLADMMNILIVLVIIAIFFAIAVSQYVSIVITKINASLSAALKTKSMFLANMSHEIRTPLTAIIGFAKSQMIENLPLKNSLRASKIILRNSEHLLTLINDILDFTKLESDKLEVENRDFSLFELLDDVQSSVVGNIGDKAVKFSINYNYPLPNSIHSDKTRLRQILLNLTGNAVKFTEQGYINFNIRYDRITHELFFELQDSGIGMSKEQQDAIFQTFSQADISTTRKYGGTGLGLTISKKLINKLGGQIKVSSELGSGSCFSFSILNQIYKKENELKYVNIPNDNVDNNSSRTDTASHASVGVSSVQVDGNVLLVEDMPDNQELIRFYLVEMGATVTIADNGKIAVDKTAETKFDLILMDMQMPVMGGFEAVKQIRQRGDKTSIVMVTANAMQEDKNQSILLGCDDFLTKPIDEESLMQVIKKYLPASNFAATQAANNENELSNQSAVKAVDEDKSNTKSDTKNTNDSGNSESDNAVSHDITKNVNSNIIVSTLMQKNSTKYSKFISKFVNYLPSYINEFSDYIDAKNDIELKLVAHKLKGVGGNMGYMALTEISRNFELAIQQGNREEITRLFEELKDTAQKIYRGMESDVKDSTG